MKWLRVLQNSERLNCRHTVGRSTTRKRVVSSGANNLPRHKYVQRYGLWTTCFGRRGFCQSSEMPAASGRGLLERLVSSICIHFTQLSIVMWHRHRNRHRNRHRHRHRHIICGIGIGIGFTPRGLHGTLLPGDALSLRGYDDDDDDCYHYYYHYQYYYYVIITISSIISSISMFIVIAIINDHYFGRSGWKQAAALIAWHYLSNATCLIQASLVLCALRRVKHHCTLLHSSPLLKKTFVRRVVIDKWFPLMGISRTLRVGRCYAAALKTCIVHNLK